jgi:hypothetical protein
LHLGASYSLEKTCRDWNEETPVDPTRWNGVGEMRELYYALQTVRNSAEFVLQRAKQINISLVVLREVVLADCKNIEICESGGRN